MTPDSLKSNETSGSSEPTAAGRPATVAGKPVTVLAPITPDTIKTMQTTLRHENLYDGPVDGKIGRKTRTAISEHQAKQGRPSTGELDDTTWRELTSPSAPS